MIASFALAAALQTGAIDWNALPPLPYRTAPVLSAEMHSFVGREVRERKCPVAPSRAATQNLQVEVAVLVESSGGIRTVVPRAIACPTIEQYAAALAAGFARNNLLPRSAAEPRWYRTTLSFSWRR